VSKAAPNTVFVSYRTTDDVAAREINELVPALEGRRESAMIGKDHPQQTSGGKAATSRAQSTGRPDIFV
jgi:hypothetical protein